MTEVVNTQVSSEDVSKVLTTLEPLLVDLPRALVTISALVLAVISQDGDVSDEKLHAVVKGASEYIVMMLSEGVSDMTPEKVN